MYPSDYLYTYALEVDNTCYTNGNNCQTSNGGIPTNGWIYNTNSNSTQWLLSPRSSIDSYAFLLDSSGFVYNTDYAPIVYGVRPTLYLISK